MENTTEIGNLRVAHWSPRTRLPDDVPPGFFVDTCLRQLYIDWSPSTESPFGSRYARPERKSGTDAYRLLLEITTGLRSAVPGETNVFGQFKNAWLAFRRRGQPAEVARLAPLMHRLINDTKAIRTAHLHGIGGASYGSLVRRLIAPHTGDRILFAGAGNLAQSMLPLFRQFEVGLWNRRTLDRQLDSVSHTFRPEHGRQSVQWADHVILTTPPDPVNDERWRRWLAASMIDSPVKTVVHLGYRDDMRNTTGLFPASRNSKIKTYCLDDLFALRQVQDERRRLQLADAFAACRISTDRLVHDDPGLRFGYLKTA